MKNFKIYLITTLLAASAVGLQEAKACVNPDFKTIYEELTKVSTISGAIEFRQGLLSSICDVEGFALLTSLEGPASRNTRFFEAYIDALRTFTLNNITRFVVGRDFKSVPQETLRSLYGKMISPSEKIRLRHLLVPMSRSCGDLTDIIYPRFEVIPSWEFSRELRYTYYRYAKMFGCATSMSRNRN